MPGKNSVATVDGAAAVGNFVNKAERLKRAHEAHRFAQAVGLDLSVDGPAFVPDPDHERPAAAAPRVGFIREGGDYAVIIGTDSYSINQLQVHGLLSESDGRILVYALKYLAKLAEMGL